MRLTFWGFTFLLLTIIESYGDLFSRTFAIPGIGHWAAIGFLEDLFAVGGAGRDHHVHRDQVAQLSGTRGTRVAVLRLAYERRVAGARR